MKYKTRLTIELNDNEVRYKKRAKKRAAGLPKGTLRSVILFLLKAFATRDIRIRRLRNGYYEWSMFLISKW